MHFVIYTFLTIGSWTLCRSRAAPYLARLRVSQRDFDNLLQAPLWIVGRAALRGSDRRLYRELEKNGYGGAKEDGEETIKSRLQDAQAHGQDRRQERQEFRRA